MHTQKVSKYVLNNLDLPYEGLVYEEQIRTNRWTSDWKGVFPYAGSFYQVRFQRGLTEDVDVDPWYEAETVTLTEVKRTDTLVTVTLTDWVAVAEKE